MTAPLQHRQHSPRLRLVDRDAVLSNLNDALVGGQGDLFLITGESGTGKSSLLRAVRDHARETLDPALHLEMVRCLPTSISYACWTPVFDRHPEIREMTPAPLGNMSPPAQGPEELVYQTAEALHRWAESHPLVLIFDDIQYADQSSLNLMLAVARQMRNSNVSLLLSCETPLSEGVPIARFVPELFHHADVHSIEIGPLSVSGIQTLIERRLEDASPEVTESLARRVWELSGGNALYVTEMLDALVETNEADSAQAIRQFGALPFSLRQLAESRLAHVSPKARETLELAAIIEESIDLELLQTITGYSIEDLIEQIEQALEHGVLIEDDRGQLRFRHGVVQQMLAERQSGLRRRRWHADILAALEERSSVPPVDIARHAEAAGNPRTAANAYRSAGHQARDLFNMPEAGLYYRKALEIAEQNGLDDALRDELRLQYADSVIRNDAALAEREYERVAARAFVRGDRAILAKARQRQAMLFYETSRRHDAVAILDDLIPELEALEDWRTLADALTCALYCAVSASDFLELDRLTGELIEVADRISEPSYRATAYFMDALARVGRGEAKGAPLAIREAIAMAMELGQLDVATPWTAVAFYRVDIFANLHHPEQVEALINRGLELDAESNRRIGLSPVNCECTPEFSYWWFLRGEWDAAREILTDPRRVRTDAQPQVLKDSVQVIAAEFALATRDFTNAHDYLEYVAPAPSTGPGDHAYQQWLMAAELHVRLALAENDTESARRWIDALDRELEHRPHVPGELMLDLSRARLLLADNEAGEAQPIAEHIVQRARQTENMLALIEGLLVLSRVWQMLGDQDRAMTAASDAIAVARQCRLRYLQMLGRINQIELAGEFGNNAEATIEELETMRQKMQEIGATAAESRLDVLIRKRSNTRPGGLTRREIEVLELIVEGKTDNEIAEILFISPRTVSTHVGNMLAKANVINRVELATWAHQNNALN